MHAGASGADARKPLKCKILLLNTRISQFQLAASPTQTE